MTKLFPSSWSTRLATFCSPVTEHAVAHPTRTPQRQTWGHCKCCLGNIENRRGSTSRRNMLGLWYCKTRTCARAPPQEWSSWFPLSPSCSHNVDCSLDQRNKTNCLLNHVARTRQRRTLLMPQCNDCPRTAFWTECTQTAPCRALKGAVTSSAMQATRLMCTIIICFAHASHGGGEGGSHDFKKQLPSVVVKPCLRA